MWLMEYMSQKVAIRILWTVCPCFLLVLHKEYWLFSSHKCCPFSAIYNVRFSDSCKHRPLIE